jgi:isoquinoline 1-oxidoreductase beta subunit
VKLLWSREEDMAHGRHHPVTMANQGLAKAEPAKPAANDQATCYTIPNLLIEHAMRNPSVPPGFWRGVNVNHNAIYIECFIDEVAAAAKLDALEFRRRLLGNRPKARWRTA